MCRCVDLDLDLVKLCCGVTDLGVIWGGAGGRLHRRYEPTSMRSISVRYDPYVQVCL